MKKFVTMALFIFWAVFTAVLVVGLIFYQQKNNQCQLAASSANKQTAVQGGAPMILDMAEIGKHSSLTDCWLLINNKIYNVSSYLTAHPGGVSTIAPYCGKEATRAFDTKDRGQAHSPAANNLLTNYYVGDLNQSVNAGQVQDKVQQTNAIKPSYRGGEDD